MKDRPKPLSSSSSDCRRFWGRRQRSCGCRPQTLIQLGPSEPSGPWPSLTRSGRILPASPPRDRGPSRPRWLPSRPRGQWRAASSGTRSTPFPQAVNLPLDIRQLFLQGVLAVRKLASDLPMKSATRSATSFPVDLADLFLQLPPGELLDAGLDGLDVGTGSDAYSGNSKSATLNARMMNGTRSRKATTFQIGGGRDAVRQRRYAGPRSNRYLPGSQTARTSLSWPLLIPERPLPPHLLPLQQRPPIHEEQREDHEQTKDHHRNVFQTPRACEEIAEAADGRLAGEQKGVRRRLSCRERTAAE